MFKVYYKGELATEQEFATIKEAKSSFVPMLAGQQGKTTDELLHETVDGEKTLTFEGNYFNPNNITQAERVCAICGKTFYVRSEKSLQKVCSDECRKEYKKQYHKAFRKKRLATNADARERLSKSNLASTKKYIARNRWQRRVELADVIMLLAKEPNGRDLVATFLDKRVIGGGKRGITNLEFRCEAEVNAEKAYTEAVAKLNENLDTTANL